MSPTISAGFNLVLVESLSLTFPFLRGVQRGDLVTFVGPINPSYSVCKRVVGLEGDKVMVDPKGSGKQDWIIVPRGHIWVLGDNPEHSVDSRDYGPISTALLRGRVLAMVRLTCEGPCMSDICSFSYIPRCNYSHRKGRKIELGRYRRSRKESWAESWAGGFK